jgi:hypothetical protein
MSILPLLMAAVIRFIGFVRGRAMGILKRALALFLLLLLVLPASAFSRTVLRMIGPEDIGGAWAEVIRIFHERQPDIKIDYISGPRSTDERQNVDIRSFLRGDCFELV